MLFINTSPAKHSSVYPYLSHRQHSLPSVFLSLTPCSNERFHWINLWLLTTSGILFQTIFPLHASLPAETRVAVACRRAERCSSCAAPWHVPAPMCQHDKGTAGAGPSSLARYAVLKACFGPGACLSRTQLFLIAGCLETDQSLNFPKPCFHPHPLRIGMQVHLETASPF